MGSTRRTLLNTGAAAVAAASAPRAFAQATGKGEAVQGAPFNATGEFKNAYRCITADFRNAPSGQSSGPLEIDRPWGSYTDAPLGLMDHLGIKRFMVMGLKQ